MKLLSLALALIQIGLAILDHIKYRRTLRDGERQAIAKLQAKFDAVAEDMRAARDAVADDDDSVRADPDNRD